ncbi:MAG: efflux transporter periplasmic adaptor subunit [Proteobacteria bacterium]|nr:efflux transporter periplasmic adaptor subunit [Pseudomonadota bacterium]
MSATTPQRQDWPQTLSANGNIAAWQEAVIGAENSSLRLTEVLVNVGDTVKKGQLLARVASETVEAELAQSRAAVTEAQATLAEARANADRARLLQPKGVISAQQFNQLVTAEQTAAARLASAQARVRTDEVRLAQMRVVAPDDGVISARAATVGSLTQPGQELFRLIRGGRLEWRAEVTADELGRLRPGTPAVLLAPDGARVSGKVRVVAPTVDPQTRNALVYVDLPTPAAGGALRAGMFARGEFELGPATALTLPQSAVLLREGFAYVFRIEGDKVAQTKIAVGRRAGERIEITGGLEPGASVVAQGAGFLADGDTVRVVAESGGSAPGVAGRQP